MPPARPDLPDIHTRFGRVILQTALEDRGVVHLDYPVESEPMDVEAWEPRRSANEVDPPHAPAEDPTKRLQQGILGAALDVAGMVPVTHHLESMTSFIDLYFEPARKAVPAPGLLGRMTRIPTLPFLYASPPDDEQSREALYLAFTLRSTWDREKRRKRPFMPQSWQITTERSKRVIDGLGLEPKKDWPPGFYFGPPLVAMDSVVLGELPVDRDSLLLRLLATGDLLEQALAEQAALEPDAIERRATRAALLAVVPPQGEAVPIDEAASSPVLRACRKTYRRWAQKLA